MEARGVVAPEFASSATQVGSIYSLSPNAASVSASRSVNMGSSAHLGGPRIRIVAAAPRSPSVRPSLFVIRTEDDGTGVADATKSNSENSTRTSPDVVNDPGSFFSTAGKPLKQNFQNPTETAKEKAGDLAYQAKSAGQDFGIKADDAKNQVAGSAEDTKDRIKEEGSKLTDEARSAGDSIQSRTSDSSTSGKSELQGIATNVKGSAEDMSSSPQSGLEEGSKKVKVGLDYASRKAENAASIKTRL